MIELREEVENSIAVSDGPKSTPIVQTSSASPKTDASETPEVPALKKPDKDW
jgi:hypothetical protein